MQRAYKAFQSGYNPDLAFRIKNSLVVLFLSKLFSIVACPGGETGRHIGLKIRRLPEKERAGSIPAPGTKNMY